MAHTEATDEMCDTYSRGWQQADQQNPNGAPPRTRTRAGLQAVLDTLTCPLLAAVQASATGGPPEQPAQP